MKLVMRKDELEFRKVKYPILYHYYYCEDSGNEFTTGELDDLNVNQAYNQYREHFNLPFPDEIASIRSKYGLSALKMSEVLGLGANAYRQYENGEVPSLSNGRLIQAASDPGEFEKMVERSGALDGKALDQVKDRINQALLAQNEFSDISLSQYLMTGTFSASAGKDTGYKTPDLNRLIEMIVYFIEALKPWKTKLNKLLFYADFCHYKKTGFGISGAQYQAIQMGPVPNNFGSIFEYANTHGKIEITYHHFQNGVGEYFTLQPGYVFHEDLFNKEELITLKYVASKFKDVSTDKIIELSHQEHGWLDNIASKQKISYEYAFELKNA